MMLGKLIIERSEDGSNSKSLCVLIENGECTFGKWREGEVDVKKKDVEASRLIVKKAAEECVSDFDLNACAKEIGRTFGGARAREVKSGTGDDRPQIALECSLERVKRNNARIMENIQKLNRTLSYTKKKEAFGISSTQSCATGLSRHCVARHGTSDKQPRWQVVWTCAECFQVWPHRELALQHSKLCCPIGSAGGIREIKTALLLQCEFCEKVYTNIPRLLKHSKTHETAKNYECNACHITFDSYKTAEQHWLLCPWLLMRYKFLLPKMLLCNTCDRKFKNYDHLYNHRYKVAHFITKTCKENNPNTAVYQCESCSQCFQGILQLTTHRSQSHGWLQVSSSL